MRSQAEFRLSCVVADYLNACAPGLVWTHFPAGEARTEVTGARLKRMGLKPGWPDFLLVLPGGILVGIELKVEGGRQSVEQKGVEADFRAVGAEYVLCRSLDHVRQTLAELGISTRESAA